MSKCGLCFSITGHEADYALLFGEEECVLKLCRYCREDLALLGFNDSKTIRLEASKPLKRKITRSCFLGPVQNLMEASG